MDKCEVLVNSEIEGVALSDDTIMNRRCPRFSRVKAWILGKACMLLCFAVVMIFLATIIVEDLFGGPNWETVGVPDDLPSFMNASATACAQSYGTMVCGDPGHVCDRDNDGWACFNSTKGRSSGRRLDTLWESVK